MARCHMCDKRIGWGDAYARRLGAERLPTCRYCVPEWRRREKEQWLTTLYEHEAPVELFRIREVKHSDTTNPQQPETLYGTLIFTDRAVIFAPSGAVREANPGVTIQFGLIGALFGHLKTRKSRREAEQSAANVPDDLEGTLQQAARLIVIPKDEINGITHGRFSGLKVRTAVKKNSKTFVLPEKRITYEEYRAAMDAYVTAGHALGTDRTGQV